MYSFHKKYVLRKEINTCLSTKEIYKIPIYEKDVTRVWYTILAKSNSSFRLEISIFTSENKSIYYREFYIKQYEEEIKGSTSIYANLDLIEITLSSPTRANVFLGIEISYNKIKPHFYWLAILATFINLISLFFLLVSAYKYIMEREYEKRKKKKKVIELSHN